MGKPTKNRIEDQMLLNEILNLSKNIQLLGKIDVGLLSESEFRVLDVLYTNRESSLSMKQVSEKTNLQPSVVSKAANVLEQKGYVKRVHSKDDRRKVQIKITETGAKVSQKYQMKRMQRLYPIIYTLSDEERKVVYQGIRIFEDTISKIRMQQNYRKKGGE